MQRELADRQARAALPPARRARLQHVAVDAVHHTIGDDELAHAVAEVKANAPGPGVRPHAALERRDDTRPRSPRHVKSRNAVPRLARTGDATLRPADQRKPAHA